jgi:hypothetical protein
LIRDFEFFRLVVELGSRPDDPVSIGGGELVEGYWWLNSWRRLDVVDWEASDMALFSTPRSQYFRVGSPLRATKWRRLVLKAPMPADEHLFGVAFVYGERRYISPELHQRLLKHEVRTHFRARFFSPPNDDLAARALRNN